MCNFESSCDLDIYLPNTIDLEEMLSYQSHEMLIHLCSIDTPTSSYRIEPQLFNPFNDDMKASLELTHEDISLIKDDILETNNIDNYSWEESTVLPHLSNTLFSSNMDEQQQNMISTRSHSNFGNLKKFSIYDKQTGKQRPPLLYEFIRLVLDDNEYSHIAEYIDRKQGIFKLHKPHEMAELWQKVKGRNSNNVMTYEKFARAIRYYYRRNIIHSSEGRFTFRFGSKSGFGTTWRPTYL